MTTNYTNKTIVFLGGNELCKDRFVNTYVNGERKRSVGGRETLTSQALVTVKNRKWMLNFEHLEMRFPDSAHRGGFATANNPARDADGIVLFYYVTSRDSFDEITQKVYKQIWKARRPPTRWVDSDPRSKAPNGLPEPDCPGVHRFGCILVGLNFERAYKERQVSREAAKQWAQTQGIRFYEMDSYGQSPVERAMRGLLKSMVWAKTRDAEDVSQEVPASSFDEILGRLPSYN